MRKRYREGGRDQRENIFRPTKRIEAKVIEFPLRVY